MPGGSQDDIGEKGAVRSQLGPLEVGNDAGYEREPHLMMQAEAGLPPLDPRATALVVVDMQNDFCHPDGYYERQGRLSDRIRVAVPAIAKLLGVARASGIPIVFTRLVYDPTLPDSMERHRLRPPGYLARHRRLEPDTWGAAVIDDLAPRPGEYIVDKSDYSAFYGTSLEQILRRRGVSTLILAGTVTYACVLHTAFDAFARDFDVVVAREGVACWAPDLEEPTFRIVELLLGRVVGIDVIIKAIDYARSE